MAQVIPEEKNLITEERRWPGGKGINVARWLKWLGAKPVVLLPLGGSTGDELAHGLDAEKIEFHGVPITEANRANVVVSQKNGPQYRFNAVRPKITAREAAAFRSAFDGLARTADLIIISGTLAPGLPTGFYRTLIAAATAMNRAAILDCDGGAFRSGIRGLPLLVKPNEFELAQWVGKTLRTESAIRESAYALSRQTRGWVMVSRGADGALLANQAADFYLTAPAAKVKVRNTVGAGDAMVAAAAWSIFNNTPPHSWLENSLATAGILTSLPPGTLPSRRIKRPQPVQPH